MEPQAQQGQEETRESAVLSRLKTIRIGKAKILNMLAALKKKDDGGEPVDRTLIEKLVASFDALKAQEEEFLTVAKRIVGEKEEDYAKAEAAGEDSSESEGDQLADEVLKTIADGETAMNVNDELLNQLRQKKQKKSALRKELEKETAEKTAEASRALEQLEFAKLKLAGERSSVDRKQQQLERLRREAVKRGYVLQNNAGGSLTSSAESPVAKTGGSSNRKVKSAANEEPLPELPGGLRVPPVPSVSGVPSDGDASKQTAEGVQSGEKPADLHAHLQQRFAAIAARKERMIQLRSRLNDAQETRTMDTTYSTAMQRLQNLTSMREQLEQLQSSGQPVTEDTLNSIGYAMDNIGRAVSATSDAARPNGSTADDVESSENDGSRRPSTVLNETQSEPILRGTTDDGDDDGELEHDQLLSHVRHAFTTKFHLDNPDPPVPPLLISAQGITNRFESLLQAIESVLKSHNRQLTRISDQVSEIASLLHQKPQTNALSNGSPFANVHPPSVGREIGDLLRQSFFAAPPETLRELSDLLSTAAAAKCDGGDPEEVSGRRTSGAGTVGPGSGAPSAVAAAAVASMIDHLIHYRLGGSSDSYTNIRAAAVAAVPGSSYPAVCCCTYPSSSNAGGAHRQSIKSDSATRRSLSSANEHSASPDACSTDLKKAEVAKRHLSSGHAKLEKKRTLERIRSFTTGKAEAAATGHASEGDLPPESNLLEKDICLIMDKAVLPWLAQHELDKVDGGLVDELRSLVLDQSRSVCFPSGYATDLFEKQLTTILDGTLAQYVGSPLSPQKEQLISDMSEILYNELAFFKLMHNSNLVVEKEE
ncbi:pericentriolar material 1 protein-like protein [Aphelenchoides avenae]|nr:pericentriolar material 1 protein-like protein [Aphelenchus avenae]